MKQVFLSDHLARAIVKCVEDATGDVIKEDLIRSDLLVTNSTGERIWDYIYTFTVRKLEAEECIVVISKIPRKMTIIYDKGTGNVITLMRENRYRTLRRRQSKRNKMHYLDCLANVLNENLRPEHEQLSLFEKLPPDLEAARLRVNEILRDLTGESHVVRHHVLFLFDTFGFQLVRARAIMVTPELEVARGCEVDLSRFISARESLITEKVDSADSVANNPGRNLKLSKKALERKKRLERKKDHSESVGSQ